jgi:hypothetical protein
MLIGGAKSSLLIAIRYASSRLAVGPTGKRCTPQAPSLSLPRLPTLPIHLTGVCCVLCVVCCVLCVCVCVVLW